MPLPFDGAISQFYENDAPKDVRAQIEGAKKKRILNPAFPYSKAWDSALYDDDIALLQIELVKMQAWARETGQRIAIVFEGRDAAGKGGTIKRFLEHLNPRHARAVALSKPTEAEAGQWYFQRYIKHLPTAGDIILFDRSWYNRGVVEHVFGFCDAKQRAAWFDQVNPFEQMLVNEGITVFKVWLNVGRATQLQRFIKREKDPLKQWKLSWIDVEGLKKWEAYSEAISETLEKTDTKAAPWIVVRSDDKKRARVAVIRAVLSGLEYAGKDEAVVKALDDKIAGGRDMWQAD